MPQLHAALSAVLLVVFVGGAPALGEEPFRYPQSKHGRGELRIVNGVPVLLVQGSPTELGEQVGVLALKPAIALTKLVDRFVKENGWERVYPVLLKTGNILLPQFPPQHRTELEAAAKTSGWPKDLLVFANTVPDLRKLTGCSALLVEAEHSTTGGPLFGRNMERPIGPVSLVTIYRRPGSRLSRPSAGMLGCTSGMNDAGLALAELTVTTAADDSPQQTAGTVHVGLARPGRVPNGGGGGQVQSLPRTIRQNVAIAINAGRPCFEITPRRWWSGRPKAESVPAPTTPGLTGDAPTAPAMRRWPKQGAGKQESPMAADGCRQSGEWTLQTMVFEPASLKLHRRLAKGRRPVAAPRSI